MTLCDRRSNAMLPALLFLMTLPIPILGTTSAAKADGTPPYEISKTEPKLALGGKATASLTITAKGGWHVNPDAPITVSLTAPAGLTTSKAKLTRNDLTKNTKETAQFDIQVEASEAGKKVLNAETKFVLCQESACKPVKETVTFNLVVAPSVGKK